MMPVLVGYVVPAIHVLACLFLIVVVLLQTGKGADMGAVFGGGSQTLFGSSGAGKSAATVFRSPPQKSPADGVSDFCAICASISLARTLLVPTSPALVPPNPFLNKLLWSLAAVEPASFDHLFFNARAPPQA